VCEGLRRGVSSFAIGGISASVLLNDLGFSCGFSFFGGVRAFNGIMGTFFSVCLLIRCNFSLVVGFITAALSSGPKCALGVSISGSCFGF